MRHYPTIWFLRHGQTEWNKVYRLQGQDDSPLTEQGQADARLQAKLLVPVLATDPDVIVSPLGRTRQTARIALGGAAYRTDPRLMEIHAGDWQGRLRDDILSDHPRLAESQATALDIYAAAPGGEGLDAFQARIKDFLNDLTRPSVIIAHGLLGQILRAEVCGVPLSEAGRLSNQQGCVYHLDHGRETVLEHIA